MTDEAEIEPQRPPNRKEVRAAIRGLRRAQQTNAPSEDQKTHKRARRYAAKAARKKNR